MSAVGNVSRTFAMLLRRQGFYEQSDGRDSLSCVPLHAAHCLSFLATDIQSFATSFCFSVREKISPYVGYEFGTDQDFVCSPECGPHRQHRRSQSWPYVSVHVKCLVRYFLDRF